MTGDDGARPGAERPSVEHRVTTRGDGVDGNIADCDYVGVDVFQAVADPVRRSLVEWLAESGQATAGELASMAHDRFGISQPTASKHLRVLREAGIVSSTVDAQRRVYRLRPQPLDELSSWAARQNHFWADRLSVLENHLTGDNP